MIVIRLGLYLSLIALTGLAAFPLYALRSTERFEGRFLKIRNALIFWSSAAILLSIYGFLALMAAMMGTSIVAIDWEMCRSILFGTPIGMAWLVRMAALAAALLLVSFVKLSDDRRLIAVATAGAIALATLVWTGHAGATEGTLGVLHKVSDMLHMFAAAVWLGGIGGFLKLLQEPADRQWRDRLVVAHRALDSFSRVGSACVAIIAVTGLVNGQVLVGLSNIGLLFETTYGLLLLVKLALVGTMMLLAGLNRWQLTPALGVAISNNDPASAIARIRWSLLAEASAALAILALVAWLGTLEPL